jgi:hypothetical protein
MEIKEEKTFIQQLWYVLEKCLEKHRVTFSCQSYKFCNNKPKQNIKNTVDAF